MFLLRNKIFFCNTLLRKACKLKIPSDIFFRKEREEAEDFERNFDVTVGDDMIEVSFLII